MRKKKSAERRPIKEYKKIQNKDRKEASREARIHKNANKKIC
jgi:hypothetical protein